MSKFKVQMTIFLTCNKLESFNESDLIILSNQSRIIKFNNNYNNEQLNEIKNEIKNWKETFLSYLIYKNNQII